MLCQGAAGLPIQLQFRQCHSLFWRCPPAQDVVLAKPRMQFPTADAQFALVSGKPPGDNGLKVLKGALGRSSPYDSVTSNDQRAPVSSSARNGYEDGMSNRCAPG